MIAGNRKDLIVLAADKCIEAAVRGLLSRPPALGIRSVAADILRHPEKDAGCRMHGVDFLTPLSASYTHALLMFDFEGCGDAVTPVLEQENTLRQGLARVWGQNADVLIIEPEVDIWVWSTSPHVESILGWKDRKPSLREWLTESGHIRAGAPKPHRPKEALEAALRVVRKPRSSSLYGNLARTVSLKECADPSFFRFRGILRKWFGVDG